MQLFGLHSYPFSKSWFENAENAWRGHSNRYKSSPLKTPAVIMGGSVYEVVSETNLPGRIASRVDFRSVLKHSVSVLICENGENGWQNHRFEFWPDRSNFPASTLMMASAWLLFSDLRSALSALANGHGFCDSRFRQP